MATFSTDIMNTVRTMVNSAINKAPYDITRKGVVLAVNGDGTCSLRIDGINYPNVPIYGGKGVLVGDIVNVLLPMNNTSGMIIMPLASGKTINAYILDTTE